MATTDDLTATSQEFFPIKIKIKFLKVPSRGSTDCNFGLGICITITFEFKLDEGLKEPPETFYNPKTEEIGGWSTIKGENKDVMEIHFPNEITQSPYHSESDLKEFLVPEDQKLGDVTFFKGKYELNKIKKDYVYNVKIATK